MSILVVDDSITQRVFLEYVLTKAGFDDLVLVGSCGEAFAYLGIDDPECRTNADVILMDIIMPEIDGIEAVRIIKKEKHLEDIPIIMVTSISDIASMEKAFGTGAMDYLIKPVKKDELTARVRSLLRLKREMDARKARERELIAVTRELEKANRELKRLANLDGLTRIANRRRFDAYLREEIDRMRMSNSPISLIMCDIDCFKLYNDTYGHQSGDDCLRAIARTISECAKRPSDMVARYGGEEFAAILPNTPLEGAADLAETIRNAVYGLHIPHHNSTVTDCVTLSLGVSGMDYYPEISPEELIGVADKALYKAKETGKNRSVCQVADM